MTFSTLESGGLIQAKAKWQRACLGLMLAGLAACSGAGLDATDTENSELQDEVCSEKCPKGPNSICHEFIATDNARHVVNYVNEFDPSKNWTSVSVGPTANSPRTIEIVRNKDAKKKRAVLVSTNTGFAELDLVDGAILRQQGGFTGVTSANRLPDESTALAIIDNITFVDESGATIRTLPLPVGPDLRAINRNPKDGHFWFSKRENIFEVDGETGAVLWQANMGVGTKGYSVWWRKHGGAYATTGDPSTVIELNASGQIVNTVGGKAEFPFLDFFSGFVRRQNGSFVVANWLGHLAAPAPDAPHLVELTSENKEVWRWGDQTLARQITSVHVLR
jgi:hypothetical protein